MIVAKTKQNKQDSSTAEFSRQVENILDTQFSWEFDNWLMKKQISDVLNGDIQKALFLLEKDVDLFEYLPANLKSDPEIIKLIVRKDPQKYKTLAVRFRQDNDVQEIALTALISGGWNLFDVIEVLKNKKWKDSKLELFTDTLIAKYKWFFPNDASRLFYDIFKTQRKLYDRIIEKWLIADNKSNVSISDKVLTHLSKVLETLEWVSQEDSKQKVLSSFLKFLWLSEKSLWKLWDEFLEILISSIDIKKKVEDENDDWDEEDDEILIDESDDDEESNYSVWPYSFTPIWTSSSISVSDSAGNQVILEESERKSMNEKSLENYVNFSLKMKQLGLSFLIDKHKSKIQLATQVNFFEWEWMSPARTLGFLNKIGKRLWVPESSYEDADWNREVLCFNDIWSAYYRFRQIAASWKIWKYDFDVASKWNNSIVELFMKIEKIIEPNSWEFSKSRFDNVKNNIQQMTA